MSDLNPLRDAVVALLEANPYLTVYDGPPQPGTYREPPYVTVYLYVPFEARTKLNGPTDRTDLAVITHSVGASITAAGIVAKNARDSLLDATVTVAGWGCRRIEHTLGREPTWDQTTGTTVVDQVDEWSFRAQPA